MMKVQNNLSAEVVSVELFNKLKNEFYLVSKFFHHSKKLGRVGEVPAHERGE
jgi:hypothetical protein